MLEFGRNIIQGLIDGIKAMISKVRDVISNVMDTVTGGISKALGIHSPSRVMMELGEYTKRGFAEDIEAAISEVSRQVQALSKAVTGINTGSTPSSTAQALNLNGP